MNPRLRLFMGTYFFSEVGRALYFIVIFWLIYKLTKDVMYTGFLISMGFLPGMLLNLVLGVFVDKNNRKHLAIIANLASSIVVILVFIGLILDFLIPWMIIAVHMFIQIFGSLFRASIQSFISEVFTREELPTVFPKTSASGEIGSLVGSTLGGLVIAEFSEEAAIFLTILSFLFATICILFTKREKMVTRKISNLSIMADLVGGIKYIKTNRILLGLFAVMFVGQLVFHASMGFLSVFTKEFLHESVKIYGILDATLSVGGITAGIIGTWWWRKNGRTLGVKSLWIVALGLILMGVSSNVPLAMAGIFFIGLGTTLLRILFQSIQQIVTGDEYHGRMASFRMMCNQTSVVISGPIIGAVAADFGINYGYLVLLIPVAACLIFAIFQSKIHQFREVTEVSR